jgi:hypothetical protein
MDSHYNAIIAILVSIAVLGLIAIPFGDPKFIDRAIILEISFATLSALIWKGYSKALYACISMAALVIIGNSLAPPHVNMMMTLVGGYILQTALIYASLRSILNMRSRRLTAAARSYKHRI